MKYGSYMYIRNIKTFFLRLTGNVTKHNKAKTSL